MTKLAVIILAAGKSTRMQSSFSKVLHKIAGNEIINHVIYSVNSLNPDKILLVISKDSIDIKNKVNAHNIEFVLQEDITGTASAVKSAMPSLRGFDGNILILCGDTPLVTTESLSSIIESLNDKNNHMIVGGFYKDEMNQYGKLILNAQNSVTNIIEFKEANKQEQEIKLCNSGVYVIKAELLKKFITQIDNNNAKGEYYFTDLVKLISRNEYKCGYVLCSEAEFLGVNNRAELANAEKYMQNILRDKAMKNGVTLLDPETVYFSYDTRLAQDVIIHPNVVFGPNVEVKKNVEIKSFSHIEGAKILEFSSIGPFARIRPDSIIDANTRIGNFVEIKNSNIANGAKINHLTYIGDAYIGRSSNIGAGTVTANYDGFKKHKTFIGDEVATGANSVLIAPVTIGGGSIIAAGSVVTKDADKDSLIIARNKQANFPGKALKIKQKKNHLT